MSILELKYKIPSQFNILQNQTDERDVNGCFCCEVDEECLHYPSSGLSWGNQIWEQQSLQKHLLDLALKRPRLSL